MRKLDASAVADAVGLPVKSGTLIHLQTAYQEAIAALGKGLAGSGYDASKVYILTGCKNTGTGNNYIIGAGAVFFNGEIYLVDATTFVISGSNVAVGIVPNGAVTTGLSFYSDVIADPVEFTDGIQRNIHQIRKCVIQAGLSGSGAANFNAFIDVTKRIQGSIGQITMWKWDTGNYEDYFNGSGAGIHPYTIGWQVCNGQGGAINMKGLVPVGYDPDDSDFSTPYNNTGGEKTHTLQKAELPAEGIGYRDRYWSESGNTISGAPFKEQQPNGGNYNGKWGASNSDQDNTYFLYLDAETDDMGSGTAHNNMQPYRSVLWVQRVA